MATGEQCPGADYDPFSFEDAIEQWHHRHELYEKRKVFRSLEPHIDSGLKAIRDDTEYTAEGLPDYVARVDAYGQQETHDLHDNFRELAERLAPAQTNPRGSVPEGSDSLWMMLHHADDLVRHALNLQEQQALEDPVTASAFTAEVLVTHPLFDSEPLDKADFARLFTFHGPSAEAKQVLTGKVVYELCHSRTALGVQHTFERRLYVLGDKTPREVIESGSPEEQARLLNWVRGGRGQIAT